MGVLWMYNGFVVGADLFEGTDISELQLRRSLETAMMRSDDKIRRARPECIVVATEEISERLANVFPGVEICVGPTSDLDEAFDGLMRSLAAPPSDPLSEFMALDKSVRSAALQAGTELFEVQPWELFDSEEPLRIDASELGLSGGRLLVMGQAGQAFGVMVFTSAADFETFSFLSGSPEGSAEAAERLPRCFSMNYVPIDPRAIGAPPEAGPRPLPVLTVFERNTQRPPSRSEARLLLAAMLGLARFVELRKNDLLDHAERGSQVTGRYTVPVLEDVVTVKLSTKT